MNAENQAGLPADVAQADPATTQTSAAGRSQHAGCPSCTNCGGITVKAFSVKDLNRQLSEQDFTYYRCRSCGLIFLRPIPDNLGHFYPQEYYGTEQQRESPLDVVKMDSEWEGYKLDIVMQFSKGKTLLELGPGRGAFAYMAKQAGFEVDVIEMSAEICQILSDYAGIRAINATDTEAAIRAEGNYDVIVAWHVIEHLPSPWSTFEAAATHLRPGGILVLATPNPSSFQFRILGRKWPHVDAPRHLQLIPYSVLERRAKELGLHPVLVTTNDQGAIRWNHFGWYKSMPHVLPQRPRRFFGPGSAKLAGWCNSLFRGIEESGFRGSAYTVVFRKD